jgi:small subunit ribosomal protein S2
MKNEESSALENAGKENAPSPEADSFSDFSALEISIEAMFKSGVHFGHHKARKNPKMRSYIFATKNNINILNLEKTAEKLKTAMDFITEIVSGGKDIIFVGTKKQAKGMIASAAKSCGMPFVSERWLGGTFTNFPVISGRTRYLCETTEKMQKGEFAKYTKFEQMKIKEELEGMERKMGGIKNMTILPGAIFAASTIEDSLAVKEAKAKNIPIVALVDTNSNPDDIDFPIPANDDAVSSLKLMLSYIVKAVLDGKEKRSVDKKENPAPIPNKV